MTSSLPILADPSLLPGGSPVILNQEQVAQMLGVSVRTLEGWRTNKNPDGLPYLAIGKRVVRYRLADVLTWLDDRLVDDRTAPGAA